MKTKPTSGIILIVDDLMENLRSHTQMLAEHGYKIQVAKTGHEAIASVNAELPDLILLDIKLPDINGYEVCTTLKANEKTSAVPVVFISALNDTAEKLSGFAAGGVDFITKPFISEEILVRVKTHVEMSRMRSQLEHQAIELRLKNEQLQIEVTEHEIAAEKLVKSYTKLEDSKTAALNLLEDLKTEIDQRKQTEEKIREAQILLKASIESPIDMIILSINKNYRYLNFNSVHKQVMSLAYGKDVQPGMNLLECITNSDDRRKAKINFDRALNGESHITIEEYGDIERYYYETRYNPIFNEKSEVIGATAFSANITDRKQAEEALQESEKRYRLLFEQARDSIMLLELPPDGIPIIRDANTAAQQTLGYSYDELIGQPISMLDAEKDFAPLIKQRNSQSQAAIGAVFEVRHRRKDGSAFYVESSVKQMTVSGKRLSLVIERDITERKQAEEVFRSLSSRNEAILASVPDIIMEVDINKIYTWANQAGIEFFGGDVIGKEALYYFEGEQETYDIVQPLFKGDKNTIYIESWQRRHDGEKRLLAWRCRVLKDKDGNVIGALSSAQDITEHKQTEETIVKERTLLKTLIDNLPNGVFVKNKDYKKILANTSHISSMAAHLSSLGLDPKTDIIGKTDFEVSSKEWAEKYFADDQKIIRDGESLINKEEHGIAPDGKKIWLLVSKIPLHDKDGEISGMIGITTDITDLKRTEEALASEQYLMVALMNNAPDRIYFKDRESRFIRISKSHSQAICLSDLTQAVGKTDFDFFTEEYARQAYEDEQTIIRTGKPLIKEEKETWANRPDTWALTTKLPLRDKERNIIGTFGTSIDITERKRSEEEVRRLNMELEQRVMERTAELSDLYNNAPCGYHLLDSDGLFVRINDTELRWLGYNREEIVGKKKFSDLLTDESARQFSMNFPVFKEQGWIKDLEFDMVHKDGSFLPVLLSGTSITDSEGNYLMSRSTITDNTERRQAEETMFESQNKLEHLNRELEAFAYSVSHDLRSPLRAIDGFTGILMEEYSTKIDEEGQRLCRVISDNALKMGQLIDDLLAFSRLNRSAINYSNVDMKVMVAKVLNEIADPEKKVKIHFTMQELPAASCDPALLKQVWINLLSNAIKYTRKCENPAITVGYEQSETETKYYVKDNGVGFEQEYAGKLYGVFQRLHKSDEFEGTGVGLAIVKRIINRHGGLVWAEGEQNKGAAFYFTLPHKKQSHEHV